MDTREAEVLAFDLMLEFGLLQQGWGFKYDHAVARLGYCDFRHRRIQLSKPITELNSREIVEDTIRHEIAHALLGPFAANHGPAWKRQAILCGAKPNTCSSVENYVPVPQDYKAVCNDCGYEEYRTRKPRAKTLFGARHKLCQHKEHKGSVTWYFKNEQMYPWLTGTYRTIEEANEAAAKLVERGINAGTIDKSS